MSNRSISPRAAESRGRLRGGTALTVTSCPLFFARLWSKWLRLEQPGILRTGPVCPPPVGPYAIGLLNPHHWGGQHELNNETVNEITLEVTRVVIAIGVFAIGVELPKVSAVEPRNWLQIASGLTHEYRRTGLFEETLEIVGHALGTWNGRE